MVRSGGPQKSESSVIPNKAVLNCLVAPYSSAQAGAWANGLCLNI